MGDQSADHSEVLQDCTSGVPSAHAGNKLGGDGGGEAPVQEVAVLVLCKHGAVSLMLLLAQRMEKAAHGGAVGVHPACELHVPPLDGRGGPQLILAGCAVDGEGDSGSGLATAAARAGRRSTNPLVLEVPLEGGQNLFVFLVFGGSQKLI